MLGSACRQSSSCGDRVSSAVIRGSSQLTKLPCCARRARRAAASAGNALLLRRSNSTKASGDDASSPATWRHAPNNKRTSQQRSPSLKLPLDRRDSSSFLSVLGLLTAGMEKLLGPKLREEDGMRVDNSALDRPVPDGSLTQLPRVTNTLSD